MAYIFANCKTRKRRWAAGVIVWLGCMVTSWIAIFAFMPSAWVTEATLASISLGTTKKEVEGFFRTHPVAAPRKIKLDNLEFHLPLDKDENGRYPLIWEGWTGVALIGFDKEDRVVSKGWFRQRDYFLKRLRE